MTSAIGMGIITAGHRHGWPVAVGGSGAITRALAALLVELGGKIETDTPINAASQLPPADVTLFDLAPGAVARILADRLPARVARAYSRFRHGPAAFKVDFAVQDGVPWTNEHARRAGTVHVGGTLAEVAAAERDCHAGRMPQRPFVLVGQQYLADPSRSAGRIHPLWTYAHVPHGYSGDATEAIIAQIERFAPGFRDRIVARTAEPAALWAARTQLCGTSMERYRPSGSRWGGRAVGAEHDNCSATQLERGQLARDGRRARHSGPRTPSPRPIALVRRDARYRMRGPAGWTHRGHHQNAEHR